MNVKSTGALFKNNQRTNDKAPEYRGDFKLTKELLDGLCHAFDRGLDKVQIAAWVRDGQKGKYFSLSISPPYEKPTDRPTGAPERPHAAKTYDDPIPF